MSPLLNIIAATTANHSVAAVHLEFKAFGGLGVLGPPLFRMAPMSAMGMRFRTALMLIEGDGTARLGAMHSS